MIRGALTLFTFASVVFFPWPLTALFAVVSSFFIPLLPFAVGMFADTLYYSPQAGTVPLFTLYGAIVTGATILVRRRLRAGIIEG
ncbi:MAG: hypothetical protein WC798_02630 [Candidatus Paceibacterota bacterium]|jgi:hypothetical protein